jgi:hypothetical protein
MSSFEIQYSFDVDRSSHAYLRKTRNDIEGYNEKEISNSEIKYIISLSLKEIAEKIAQHNIVDNEEFVIKSYEKEIAIAIAPKHVLDNFWELVVTTVFRESYDNPFRVGKNQIVIWID